MVKPQFRIGPLNAEFCATVNGLDIYTTYSAKAPFVAVYAPYKYRCMSDFKACFAGVARQYSWANIDTDVCIATFTAYSNLLHRYAWFRVVLTSEHDVRFELDDKGIFTPIKSISSHFIHSAAAQMGLF